MTSGHGLLLLLLGCLLPGGGFWSEEVDTEACAFVAPRLRGKAPPVSPTTNPACCKLGWSLTWARSVPPGRLLGAMRGVLTTHVKGPFAIALLVVLMQPIDSESIEGSVVLSMSKDRLSEVGGGGTTTVQGPALDPGSLSA